MSGKVHVMDHPLVAHKLTILRELIDAGFKVIEVGSFMHPKKVPQMADTDELFKAQAAAEQLRSQIKGYLDEAGRAQSEASELKREVFRLQQKLDAQAHKAKLILSKAGELMDYREYRRRMAEA